MSRMQYNRREVLTLIGSGASAILLIAYASQPSMENKTFTFM